MSQRTILPNYVYASISLYLGNNFQSSTNIYTIIIPTANALDPKILNPSQNSETDKSRILIHKSKASKQKKHVREISTKITNTTQQQTYIPSKSYAVCFVGNSKCKFRNVKRHPSTKFRRNYENTIYFVFSDCKLCIEQICNKVDY